MVVELPLHLTTNIRSFTGRTWLLAPILDWLEKSSERVFLLLGKPGCGKSMFIAWLAGDGPMPDDSFQQAQLDHLRAQVSAAYFCMASSRNISPLAFAENIANQLTRNVGGFSTALAATLSDRVQFTINQDIGKIDEGGGVTGFIIERLDIGRLGGDEEAFDRGFCQPIKKLYASGYQKPILILIDGLDEAQTYTGSITLVNLLSRLADLPAQVRILVTSRPDPRVLSLFQTARSLDMVDNAPEDVDDIPIYVHKRLAEMVPSLDEDRLMQYTETIRHAAQGIFLYPKLVLDDLVEHLPELPDPEGISFPKGLGGIYHEFLNREIGSNRHQWFSLFRPILGMIAVAQGEGFTRQHIEAILETNVEEILEICQQYLVGELPDGPFRIFHRSLVDFLLYDSENKHFHIPEEEMHSKIAEYYFRAYQANWAQTDDYGLEYIIYHLLEANLEPIHLERSLKSLIDDKFIYERGNRSGWHRSLVMDLYKLQDKAPCYVVDPCVKILGGSHRNSLVNQEIIRLLRQIYSTIRKAPTCLLNPPVGSKEEIIRLVLDALDQDSSKAYVLLRDLLMKTANVQMQGAIILALGETGSLQACSLLVNSLLNPLSFVRNPRDAGHLRWCSADGLIALKDPACITPLVSAFWQKGTNDWVKQQIIYTLGRMKANLPLNEKYKMIDHGLRLRQDCRIRFVDAIYLLVPEEEPARMEWRKKYEHQVWQVLDMTLDPSSSVHESWSQTLLCKRAITTLGRIGTIDSLPYLHDLNQKLTAARETNRSKVDDAELIKAVTRALNDLGQGAVIMKMWSLRQNWFLNDGSGYNHSH
jgi:hypothetical protein